MNAPWPRARGHRAGQMPTGQLPAALRFQPRYVQFFTRDGINFKLIEPDDGITLNLDIRAVANLSRMQFPTDWRNDIAFAFPLRHAMLFDQHARAIALAFLARVG